MKELLNYLIKEFEGIRVIEFDGNLTANTITNFEFLIQSFADKENLILNMSEVKVITSSGLLSLVDLSNFAKENDNRIIFLWPSEDIIQMAETLDVRDYLIFADSYDEGQTKISFYTK